MKKQGTKLVAVILIVIAIIINGIGIVNAETGDNAASSLDVRMSTTTPEVEKGKEISVLISLADINVGDGVNTLKGTVTYDTEKLEYVNSEAQNGWSITYNSTNGTLLVVYMSGLVQQDQGIAKLTFRVKDTVAEGNTTVSLTNIESSNDEEKVTPTDASLTINVVGTQQDNNNNGNNNNNNNGNNANQNSNQGSANQGNASGSATQGSSTNANQSNKSIPKTGTNNIIIPIVILVAVVIGIVSYMNYKKYRGI